MIELLQRTSYTNDCLLSVGSPLLGSTVAEFALNPVSINDAGQLAIRVSLDDTRQFILRADPTKPESGSHHA